MIAYLEQLSKKFEGKVLQVEGRANLRTQEGVEAVKEAIEFLKKAGSNPPLKWNEDLQKAAKEHVDDIGPKGMIQHESSQNISARERIEKFGLFINCYGENLSFFCDKAEDVVA